MDLHSYPQVEHGRFEQILNQFLLKSLHIILDSRVPANRPSSRSGEVKKSDKWFNLVLGDRPSAMDSLSFWNRSLMEPMIIDVILVQESPSYSPEPTETVVERWIVQYESQRTITSQSTEASYKKTYKKSIILLRSVYSMLRLLPAYKAYRKQTSLKQNCDFEINYKISSFASPFSREEEYLMKNYKFTSVEAQQGRLSVSVTYREDLSDFNLDSFVTCPLEIITDYVGSPLTDPMRVFPSTSSDTSRATSFPIRGKQTNHPSPFQRPHSWTSGVHMDLSSRQNQQPFSGSPPLYRSPYEYSLSPTETYIHRDQNQRVLHNHKMTLTSDCELLSPPLSSSPSPSPPTYPLNHFQTRPMSIPHPMMARSPRHLSPNLSDPSRHPLPPLSPRNTKNDHSSHESSSGMRRHNSLRVGDLSNNLINAQKLSRDAKEDSGRFSSLLSSSSSPRVGFSRSSSRLSFQDDFGDCDFSCPFIVDDVDPPDSQTRVLLLRSNSDIILDASFMPNGPHKTSNRLRSLSYSRVLQFLTRTKGLTLDGRNSSEVSSQTSSTAKKSQDAAVGALVHMLRTAPPLRQDSSYCSTSNSSKIEPGGGAVSEFFKPRKTSDALEELKVYREMKDLLLLSKSAAASTAGK
ncbi:hypothetical protein OROHE_021778 [Orobanche hederae]